MTQQNKKRGRWSKEEMDILIDQIKKTPNNLIQAFKRTSLLINRSPHAIRQYWYSVLSKKETTEVCFMTIGYHTVNRNRKNVHVYTSNNTEGLSKSKWNKVLAILSKK